MKLDDAQLKQVAAWFAAGESLSEIQRRINDGFKISCTYLDVRLLVAELPQPDEPASPAPAADTEPSAADAGIPGGEVDDGGAMPPDGDLPPDRDLPPDGDLPPGGVVSVDIDAIVPPGAMAAGSVTFSDGAAGKWYLDQMGRMGLTGFDPGYRPPPEDTAEFQRQLMDLLRKKGLIP